MIVSSPVLAQIADRWDDKGLFKSRTYDLVAGWCVKYYRKYHRAPGDQIETIFDRWAEKKEGKKDQETVRLVEKFLDSLSGSYTREKKRVQIQYTIDLAAEHFNAVKADETCDEVKGLIEDGKIHEAIALMDGYQKVEMQTGRRVSVLRDKKALYRAFADKGEPVIRFDAPEDVGLKTFFGQSLLRDTFILFEGPEKRGKSWIMIDMAWRAMEQGKRVAMFQVGDLSEAQTMRRFAIRAAGRPLDPTDKPVHIPVGIIPPREEGGLAEVPFRKKRWTDALDPKHTWKAMKKIVQPWGKGPENDLLMLDVYPNSSISINEIRGVLASWKRSINWSPDVVVIDYADILAPIDGKVDTRFQIDATHRGMKRLSQELHCLLISATQTNKESYDAPTIEMKHSSESKTKNAHANGIIGINRTDEEKKHGIYRFNWVAGREWDYTSDVCCYAAGSLSLANPLMFSTM